MFHCVILLENCFFKERKKMEQGNTYGYTFTAVLPHPEIHFRNFSTASVTMWELSHSKNITLYSGYVVPIVTENSCKGGLFDLSQLRWSKHTWVLIP